MALLSKTIQVKHRPSVTWLFDLTWEIEAALAALKATRRGTRDFM